jgi:NADPH-dependent glutamate synthase beta subunit-like oxidoreductase/coenzyme F420-reducing hydrogenase delta subunit/Pyruvate/2-oxoacid:ferredoxin oxidoreductase delta subunit
LVVPSLQSEPLPIRVVQPAPCTQACPAGINVKAYVSLIAEKRFAEALEVIRQRCPLPGICGRVCPHPCELVCERRAVDAPIAIRVLKRFVADYETEVSDLALPSRETGREEKVAVVGSGPAGLTAAYDLVLAGYSVTVYESQGQPGGMLRHGITAYRLPREILDREIETLCRAGIEIRTGCRIGVDLGLEDLLDQGYDAALLAVGAQLGRHLGVEGEETCAGVQDALTFLRRVNDGDRTSPGDRVVVIGGGSTAVEAARSALRLGAESVDILYRRYREELLADPEEIAAAEAEGIAFRFLVTPSRVTTAGGRLRALECVRVGLGEPDASGRRRPIEIPGSQFTVEADRVLTAVGQEVDLDFLPPQFQPRLLNRGLLSTDAITTMTPWHGIFAAGDAVSGPATVIDAIAQGHRAAEAIGEFLVRGRSLSAENLRDQKLPVEYELPDTSPIEAMRVEPKLRQVSPGREFSEVEGRLSEPEVVAEARRCLRCGPCGECRICAPSCRRRHVMIRRAENGQPDPRPSVLLRTPGTIALSLSSKQPTPGRLLPEIRPRTLLEIGSQEGEAIEVLPVRARIYRSLCRGCAECVDVCPFDAITMVIDEEFPEHARIEASLCRGCNLCAGICPTGAVIPTALSPDWWSSRLDGCFNGELSAEGSDRPFVVLACQRRAGATGEALVSEGSKIEIIRFRCVGQLQVGMLLELQRRGARGVLVTGCQHERCRFGRGARLAADQIEKARIMFGLMGVDRDFIQTSWSTERRTDPIDWSIDATGLAASSRETWPN